MKMSTKNCVEDDSDFVFVGDVSNDNAIVIPNQNDTGVTSSSSHDISDEWMGVATNQTPLDCGNIDANSTMQYYYKLLELFFEKMKNP